MFRYCPFEKLSCQLIIKQHDRKQRVNIGHSYSDYTNVASGVPQGSCTGPLLFILYINDLPDYNSDMNTDISLFADDSKISTVLSDVSKRSTMQKRLNQFMEWADRWQLKIAEHKCCVLTLGSYILPTYYLNGVQLLNVKEFRLNSIFHTFVVRHIAPSM